MDLILGWETVYLVGIKACGLQMERLRYQMSKYPGNYPE